MRLSKSDNAVTAKVHALYGKRLGAECYGQLLQKRSLAEITGFLKNETYYSDELSEVKEELVHREQLELILQRRELDIYVKLRRYASGGDIFFKMYTMKNEIRQILFAMRLLNAGTMDKFIVSLPGYLAKHLSFDLFRIAKAKNYDDLLDALAHTGYYEIIGKFRPVTSGRAIDIPLCESALLTDYYTKLLDMAREHYTGETRRDLERILYYRIDAHNINIIYRMKHFFKADRKTVEGCLLPIRASLSRAVYNELLDAADVRGLSHVLTSNRRPSPFPDSPKFTPEQVIFNEQRIQRHLSQQVFRFSKISAVVVICYTMLLEIEVNNIVNIIEGVRYGLSPEEIRSMLVI